MMCDAARDCLFAEIATATPALRDHYLDLYLDWRDHATEWDAELWGFEPDAWMLAERQTMERRASKRRSY